MIPGARDFSLRSKWQHGCNFSKKGGTRPPSPREVNSRGSSPAVGRFAPSGLPSLFPRLIEMIPSFDRQFPRQHSKRYLFLGMHPLFLDRQVFLSIHPHPHFSAAKNSSYFSIFFDTVATLQTDFLSNTVIASEAKQSSSSSSSSSYQEIASSLRSSQWHNNQFVCQFSTVSFFLI